MFKLFAGVAVCVALGAVIMLSVPSSADTSLLASPDTFTMYANTRFHDLPVIDNDASKGGADVEVCRYTNDLTHLDTSNAGLVGYRVQGKLWGTFHQTIQASYQLCDTTSLSPVTTVTINVKRLIPVRSKRLDHGHVKIVNGNDHSVLCVIGSRPIHKVDANSTRVLASVKGSRDDNWTCILHQKLGDAVAGSWDGLR
jgi:hypothetical protein